MRRQTWAAPLLGFWLLAGCAAGPVPPGPATTRPAAPAAPAGRTGPVAVVPSRALPPDEAARMAARIAAEGRRALVDLAVAADPVASAPTVHRRVLLALAALGRLPAETAGVAGHRAFLGATEQFVAAAARLEAPRLAQAAAVLAGQEAGAAAGGKVQPAVAGALAALRRRYLTPWPRRTLLYLTFEGGPDPATTPLLLKQLDQTSVKGTFFIAPAQAAEHPDLIKAITAAGHAVGLVVPAPPAGLLEPPDFREPLEAAAAAIKAAGAPNKPRLVRLLPGDQAWQRPHAHTLEAAGYVVLQGTVPVRLTQPGRQALLAEAGRRWNGGGPVVLALHETAALAQTPDAIAAVVALFRSHGFAPSQPHPNGPGLWPAAGQFLQP